MSPTWRVPEGQSHVGSQQDPDWAVRLNAFRSLERLSLVHDGPIPWGALSAGFEHQGRRVHYASQALGIFKPRQMSAALSVKTVLPRAGRAAKYRDQVGGMDSDSGLVSYDLAAGGLESASNRHLQEAFLRRAPVIYFRAIEPGVYEAVWPVWIADFRLWDGRVFLAAQDTIRPAVSSVDAVASEMPPMVMESSHSWSLTRRRNHQAWFSSSVKAAYGYRCALSGLPIRDLLVGAQIRPGPEEGPVAVSNGICMSALHRAAFDANLLGVDPDFRIHVAPEVSSRQDGLLLETLKAMHGTRLRTPANLEARPNPACLEWRFDRFKRAV